MDAPRGRQRARPPHCALAALPSFRAPTDDLPALRSHGAAPSVDAVSKDEHVVLPDAEVIRLGFEDITYRVSGRRLTVPYTVVQPGSVIVLGARGPLILPKSVVEGLLWKPS